MSVLSGLQRLFGGAVLANGSAQSSADAINYRIEPRELPDASLYGLLKTLYLTTGAYEDLRQARVILNREAPQMKAIRNPISVAVDAWGSKLYPSPLTVVTENPAIVEPLALVWKWSNWRAKQSTFARWAALYGEAFHKIQADQERGRVWFEYVEPMYVTEWEEDPRGYLTYVRVDIPKVDDTASGLRRYTHTEVWSTDKQTYRRWETDGDACGRKLRDLGAPKETSAYRTFGIDFTPWVRTPFSDIGERRGIGAIQLALEAIFEADLSATNLHATLYQDIDGQWVATASGTDANGRPVPPMRIQTAEPTFDALGRQTSNGIGAQADGSITVGKRSFWRLSPGYDLKSVVPNIDYAAALAILKDHDEHLERLIPALSYARISEMGGADLSGRAIRFKLTPFIDQVTGVRATALEKLEQADAMALTLGRVNGIPGFDGIGTFDEGSFAHEFEDADVIPLSDLEEAQAELQRAQAYSTWRTAGLPDAEALQRSGYSRTDALRIVRLAANEVEQAMERQQALMEAQPAPDQQGQEGQ